MECIYCECSLPNNAKFCPKCLRQIVCIDCGEVLFKDSSICISCGNPLKNSNYSNNDAVNNIEFTENENGKTFKASFTNTVAGNVVETFAQLLPMNNYSSKKYLQVAQDGNDVVDIANAEVLESTQNLTLNPTNSVVSNNQSNLEKIFKNKNGSISIYETRIKAANRKDFVARITLLFLYYKKILGVYEVERAELNTILSSEKLYDGAFRSWLSANRTLIDNKQTYLELRPEGIELAEKYLSDFLDNSTPNLWDLKNSKKNGSTKSDLKDNAVAGDKPKTSKKILTYQIVQSLNLKPSGKKSFVDFCAEYIITSNFEYNLLFVYYLERVLNEKSIDINHVYTCYKALNVKVPNIYQSIADTKKRKGWIDSSNMNNLKISVAGENHLEHSMKKGIR